MQRGGARLPEGGDMETASPCHAACPHSGWHTIKPPESPDASQVQSWFAVAVPFYLAVDAHQ